MVTSAKGIKFDGKPVGTIWPKLIYQDIPSKDFNSFKTSPGLWIPPKPGAVDYKILLRQ